jgi:hypothetical protein
MDFAVPKLISREAGDDPIHAALKQALERRERTWLWIEEHAFWFTPKVLPMIYGDGRALFSLSTINQRPRYWIIRGCSSWGCGSDREDGDGPDFGEFSDEILTDLEEAFGNGRCGYSGNSLFWPKKERKLSCRCEDCTEAPVAKWPMVDGAGGCSWSRLDWPKAFATVPHPLTYSTNMLADAPPVSNSPALPTAVAI